eukprot:8652483-Karenia_brevis.AAC.1
MCIRDSGGAHVKVNAKLREMSIAVSIEDETLTGLGFRVAFSPRGAASCGCDAAFGRHSGRRGGGRRTC